MPTYEHVCDSCGYEWEDFYSINADPPTKCPNCGKETVKRLISGGSGKGIVELSGTELKNSLASAGKNIKNQAANNEKLLANLVGESRYQQNVTNAEKKR